ncbi:alkyl/aryl-sulfatase [Acinetobacter guerrae]|uniref:alkyl/aryl-sulfatase n=1 Tax=Acinetobacter guerrae TaxID=1843371 RepID=UPI00125EFCA1|nr:alkyl sulfatase dimerization domain-containing protein [Acinetobacter guerrae]
MNQSSLNKKLIFTVLMSSMLCTNLYAKPATTTTQQANNAIYNVLPFNDKKDFEDAQRGLLLKPEHLTIKDEKTGKVVWDLESFKQYIKLENPAPPSVNPSLWRNAQLNLQYGLFEVKPGIYQVRGYDLANITFIRGKTGWIVFDVGSVNETAKAAYDLVTEKFGKLPIVAIMYSHPHVDHYGGVKGLITDQDARSGKVKVIAPDGFMEHAISEGVISGNVMSRRAIYMYGALLPRSPEGSVGAGLGLTNPGGTTTIIEPNTLVKKTGEKLNVDGVEMVFQMTPGTEAPAEMNVYLPQFKAMWMAENTTATMHNILTLRGAQVRDALNWSKYINETIELYGNDIDVKFQSHHWPVWGKDQVHDYLEKQRDLYKFIHDQSVYLMNKGYTGEEIAEMIKLPPSLENFWDGRSYYGTLKHNSRAVYQRYVGWYDGNPSSLDVLPPVDAAKKYVEYMGGEQQVIERAKKDFSKGEYRWLAMALKHVVFANPNNVEAKNLLADTYEQLGYQAESGPWRSVYLQGAYELRNGVPNRQLSGTVSPDTIQAMQPDLLFDFWGVRLNAEKAQGKRLAVNFNFPDLKKDYTVSVSNSVLNYSTVPTTKVDATVTLNKTTLNAIQLKQATWQDKIKSGDIKITGNQQALTDLVGLIDEYPFWFNIVTP